jgi:hypothetical protein
MAGGIDWFRWHHGSVTDPKFQLVARKSGASLPDVLAVWAYVLEQASANETRGNHGEIDCEAVDCMFGFDDGQTEAIMNVMRSRGLLSDGRVSSWDKRQPKRERDTDNSAERTRAYRERQKQQCDADKNHVTPCDATERQKNARGEKSRVNTQPIGCGDETGVSPHADANGVQTSRQTADNCPHQQIIDLYHQTLPTGRQVREWTPARQAALRSRWRENPKRQTLDWWGRYFAYCAKSKFLTGQTHSPGRRPFELSLDWLVKPENMAKVIEGAYHEAETEAA